MDKEKKIENYEENEEEILGVLEITRGLIKKLHIILLAGFMGAVLVAAGTKLLVTPQYTSTTKLYVFVHSENNEIITYNNLQIGTQLIKDYVELVKSRPVLEQTINNLQLDMTIDKLKKNITVTNPTDTHIISINVEYEDAKTAKKMADQIRKIVAKQITDVTNTTSVNTVEEGSLPDKPSSPSIGRNAAVGGLSGIIIAVMIIIIEIIIDDTIKTTDDVERYLNLPVLASVPVGGYVNKGKNKGQDKKWKKLY